MDVVGQYFKSIGGSIDKAIILLRDYDSKLWSDKEDNNPTALGGKMASATAALSNAATTASALASALDNPEMISKAGAKYVPFEVQYNPSSITFISRGGSTRLTNSSIGGPGESSYIPTERPSETLMSFELIIDDTNIADAFMRDAFTISPTLGGAAQAARNIALDYSVQRFTEVFVAAITRIHTRMMGFCWKEMLFWGELVNVDLTYTMFNNLGNPIRAELRLTLRQDQIVPAEGEEAPEQEYATEQIWEKAYQNLFSKKARANNKFGVVNYASNIFQI